VEAAAFDFSEKGPDGAREKGSRRHRDALAPAFITVGFNDSLKWSTPPIVVFSSFAYFMVLN
tara:strand:- start:204 stop:389 length:186 start_codon:yes stop_codon:yes gene_type:complete